MSFCFKCGKEIEDNAGFCPYCGANQQYQTDKTTSTDNNAIQSNNSLKKNESTPKEKGGSHKIIIIILSVLLALVIIGVILYFILSNNKKTSSDSTSNVTANYSVETNVSNTTNSTANKTSDLTSSPQKDYDFTLNTEYSDPYDHYTVKLPSGFRIVDSDLHSSKYADVFNNTILFGVYENVDNRSTEKVLNDLKNELQATSSSETLNGDSFILNSTISTVEKQFDYYIVKGNTLYVYSYNYSNNIEDEATAEDMTACAMDGELLKLTK